MLKTIFITKREHTILVALGVFLITLPISYGLNSVSAILIGSLFILDSPKRVKSKFYGVFKNKLFLFFVCFLAIQLIGFLYSENIPEALRILRKLVPFLALPITILTEDLNKKKVLELVKFFKYYLFIVLLLAVAYQYFYYGNILTFEDETFSKVKIGTFYFSAFIYVAILESLFSLAEGNFKDLKQYVFILFFSFMLLLLGARISILILLFCLILFVFRLFPERSVFSKLVISIILMAIGFYASYQIPPVKRKIDISWKTLDFDFNTILTKNQISNSRNSIEYRVLINYCSYQILKLNPIGVGIGDYRDTLNKEYEKLDFRAGKKYKFNSHNQYAEEFIKQGVLGGVFFIVLILFLLVRGSKQKFYFYYISIYIALVCFVESFLFRQHGVMFTTFFLPLFYNIEKLDEH